MIYTEVARAKINLDLRLVGRRDDGYHLLDSIVVFADYGDIITYEPCHKAGEFSLSIKGEFGKDLQGTDDNLILAAARLLSQHEKLQSFGHFTLDKKLPVASGIGGGSADAAAALRVLIKAYDLKISDQNLARIALQLGADVPICLKSIPIRMQGIGEVITEFSISDPLYMVLVNPLIEISTKVVFEYFHKQSASFSSERVDFLSSFNRDSLIKLCVESQNDLEEPACRIGPKISKILASLKNQNTILSRMSGSGATCFGVFETREDAVAALKELLNFDKNIWVQCCEV